MKKHIILSAFICFSLISCKTKEAIVPIEEFSSYTSGRTTALPKNLYFKDVNGLNQKFTGTWIGGYNGNKFELDITEYKEWKSEQSTIKYDQLLMLYKVTDSSGVVLRNTLDLPEKEAMTHLVEGQTFDENNNYVFLYVVTENEDCKYFAIMNVGLINQDTQLELFLYPKKPIQQDCGDIVIDPLFPAKDEPALILSRI